MGSASLRVYSGGPYTLPARRQLLLNYLNALPLAAQPGYGEVASLGDGLESWFGSPFAEVNRVLADPAAPLAERARYYKQVLALILAVRRPTHYLRDTASLAALTDSHLRRMARDGVIPGDLAAAAQAAPLVLRARAGASPVIDFTRQKGVNLARTQLLSLLGVRSLYELDRFDLTARTTLDATVQQEVTTFLRGLADPARIEELGLTGTRLLRASDPSKVVYSLTLYERGEGVNHLRINADNLDQPLDINAGAKLDLGSTAKLRTLVSWLELIAEAHERSVAAPDLARARAELHPRDRLSAWVLDYLGRQPRRQPRRHARGRDAAPLLRRYRADLLHRRRRAPLRQLREPRQQRRDDGGRGAAPFGEPGVHPHDARGRGPLHVPRALDHRAAAGERRRPGTRRIPQALRRSRGQRLPAPLLPEVPRQEPRRGAARRCSTACA